MTIHERMIPRTEREKDLLKYGRSQARERIINDLKDQFAFVMEAETKEGLDQLANSIQWSERWQLTFNGLIALIKVENNE